VFVGRDAAGVHRYVERTIRGTRRDAEREAARVVVEVDEFPFVDLIHVNDAARMTASMAGNDTSPPRR
jgi:hypothetical protein